MRALPRPCGHHWGQQHIHEPGVSRDHVTYCASGHIGVLCVGRSSSSCLRPALEVDLAHSPYIWDRNPVLSGSIVCSDTIHVILGCYSRPTPDVAQLPLFSNMPEFLFISAQTAASKIPIKINRHYNGLLWPLLFPWETFWVLDLQLVESLQSLLLISSYSVYSASGWL